MAINRDATASTRASDYYAKKNAAVAEASQKSAERTLSQKFASGVARMVRPIARTALAPVALAEAAVDTVGGLLAGESREEISRNVNDALTRGRTLGVLGGSNVRPIGIDKTGVGTTGDWKRDVGSFVGDTLTTGVAAGSLIAPTSLATRGVAPLIKSMAVGGVAEGIASGVGETATQIQEGEIRPGEIASATLFGTAFGAALPGLGRVIGNIFPSLLSKEARAARLAESSKLFNSEIAENATKNTLIYRLTDKSPDDLRKTLNRIVSKNDEVTQLSGRIADEEAALKALKETDMEANIRPALEEIRVARETTAVPMRERLLEVARQNNPTKARTLVQGAVKNIDSALSKLKKSTSEYKKLTVAKNALLDGANYLLRDSKDLQRLGFQELPEFADDVIKILDSIPDSNAARLASNKIKQAANTSRKAFQALEDAKTKPQAFVKAAQDKLRATSQSKLAQQIARKTEELEALKANKKAALDEVLSLENTPEALYARELSGKFGSIDNFEKSFEIVDGPNGKKVSSFIVPKETADFFKANIKSLRTAGNLFNFGTDTIRAWESLAKNGESLQFIRQNIIKPIMQAAGNYSKKTTMHTKRVLDLAKKAGVDFDRLPLLGMRKNFLKTGKTQAVAASRAEIGRLLEEGVPIEKMPEQYQELARYLRDGWDYGFDAINKNRKLLGLPELNFRKNYVTHPRAYSFLRELGMKDADITDDVLEKWVFRRSEAAAKERSLMPYENMRKDSANYDNDPIEAFLSYMYYAERDIEMNHLSAYLRPYIKMVGEGTDKATEQFFTRWNNEGVLGYASAIDVKLDSLLSTVNLSKAISKIGSMYSNATLAGNIGSILSQFTTIPLIAAKSGRIFNTVKALGLALSSDSAWLRSQSKTLQRIEKAMEESDMVMARMLKQGENLGGSTVSDFLSSGLEYADSIVSKTAFIEEYTALTKAGVSHQQAVNLADDFAGKLNGLYDKIFVPQLLRSKGVKGAIPFQTYAYNLFNSLSRDALIIGNTEGKAKAAVYLTKMIGTMLVVNHFYNRLLGQEPYPVTEDGNFTPFGALPIVGGMPKYGVPGVFNAAIWTPGKFLFATLNHDTDMLEDAKKDLPNMLRLFGVPGTAQFFKTIKGAQVVGDGKIKSGNTTIKVEGTEDVLRTLIFGKWGSQKAQEYIDKQKAAKKERFYEELFGE